LKDLRCCRCSNMVVGFVLVQINSSFVISVWMLGN
jgi:hypothetical protein